ncbi:TPA: APC family permease [Clostridium botulinum]|uniref:APC family permease n=1 Tax=Clostridium botulinum TaxID=1491 RepID=UPI0008FC6C2E|nr:amino acid permease [Clostridium botulinum]APC80178.1 amino acid permease family protein [Clostridium botulinum]MCS4449265.1 amino acid permease [Clostridium botulinum]MCS4457451.1 amino acid permease [Clostridium botulinum]MCS4461051.1 amino acid permease [Clostridium botulinum]MCS4514551.1 amino acid permease [Clostridium botulinum]
MKKKIGLWDLVFMNVSALFGIRWIAKSTASSFGLGLGAIPAWVLFAFIFFLPSALICAELAATYPRDGGLYEWVKEAYGEKWGFMVSWLNWTAKLFWYSSFLTFLIVNVSYTLGKPELAGNKMFVLICSLVIFWILSLISTKGMAFAKIFTNVGALGSTVPAILLIVMAFVSVLVFGHKPASTYTVATLTPKLNMDTLAAISSVMFGLAGAETAANFVTEIDDAKKTFPKAILISAAIVGGLYVLGSIAITMILPVDKITASEGILAALGTVAANLGIGPWFIRIIALGISLSVFGAIILYIASPIKMLFGSVKKGIFTEKFTKVNEHNIPVQAVILQAVIVSIILLTTTLLPSVDAIYNVLVTMTALTSLFPYVLLFRSYIKLRQDRPNEVRPYEMSKNNRKAIFIANMVLIISVIGIVLSAAPVMPTLGENIVYELEMIGGAILVIGIGLWKWNNFVKKTGFREEK